MLASPLCFLPWKGPASRPQEAWCTFPTVILSAQTGRLGAGGVGDHRPGLGVCCWLGGSPGPALSGLCPAQCLGASLQSLACRRGRDWLPQLPYQLWLAQPFLPINTVSPPSRRPGDAQGKLRLGRPGWRGMCPWDLAGRGVCGIWQHLLAVPGTQAGARCEADGALGSPLLAPAGRGPPAAPAPAPARPWRAPPAAGSSLLLSETGPGGTVEEWLLKTPAGRSVSLATCPCSGKGQHPRGCHIPRGACGGALSPLPTWSSLCTCVHAAAPLGALHPPHCAPVQYLLLPRPPPSRGPPTPLGNTAHGAHSGNH